MADESDAKPADAPSASKPPDAPSASKADESAPSESAKAPVAETPAAGTSSEPTRKKKKKKKKKRAVETSEETAERPAERALGPEGWERPGFVLDFPKDEELERLVRAFELGNYAFVREHAKKLAASSTDEDVRRAAGELLRRIDPDPLVKILFLMSVGLLLFMVVYAYRSHGH